MRRVVLPLVALLLAGAATFVARGWLEREPQAGPVAEPASPQIAKAVLVAGAELAVGSFVQPDSLRWQDWPRCRAAGQLLSARADRRAGAGRRRRAPAAGGRRAADAGSVVKPGERGFLAAVLDPGMRAISVPIDEAAGNAGLVLPGDRVDLILTQTINAEGDAGAARRVSETVLEDLRVIAMGRRLSSGEGEEAQASRTATLEASPDAVEKVALVERARQARPQPAQPRRSRCRP